MSRYGVTRGVIALGLSPRQLRADRILDDARASADPVRLMRTFGIAANTALRYVHAAHPEHFIGDPIQP